ncbi:MAG: TIGR03663 family protein [Verrucomicrobia bacterium]|nr:MAG: TIGR03663 family protein [Verrucomicrobiota bacterium]
MNRLSALALLLAIVGALALRLPHLDARPLHNDEAVNAIKLAALIDHGEYAYDPHEYHGPALHYFSRAILWFAGVKNSSQLNDITLRLTPVAFGAGLILLLILFADGLGSTAILCAAIFLAISPAMVFYSRYFIHEMLLVFFTALTIGAGWRYVQTRLARWAVVAGAGGGLMWATKETFVLQLAAMFIAAILTWQWERRRSLGDSSLSPSDGERAGVRGNLLTATTWLHISLAVFTMLLVWLAFFSSFFTHWRALEDSFRTYQPWLVRVGGDSPHLHPWNFYLERLAWHPGKHVVWSEGLILLLALIGAGVSLFGKKSSLHHFLALYTILLAAIYSAISYKTPWCLLGFLYGMVLLAGIGAETLWGLCHSRRLRWLTISVLSVLAIQLTAQSWRTSVTQATNRRNPYAYAQTLPPARELVERIEALAKIHPAGHAMTVKVISPESYWPLPWYLRDYSRVGWWDQLPSDALAPVVVVSANLHAALDEQTDKRWLMVGYYEIRPQVFFELYVELELWKKYISTLPPPTDSPSELGEGNWRRAPVPGAATSHRKAT